jgi:hypothetical protein
LKIRVISPFAGDRFFFSTGQIIECPGKVGERLVAHGIGEEAPGDSPACGTFDDETPKEERTAPAAPAKRAPEKATMTAPEKAVTGAAPGGKCTGTTKQGNPCLRIPLPGTDRCAGHPREE